MDREGDKRGKKSKTKMGVRMRKGREERIRKVEQYVQGKQEEQKKGRMRQ